MTLLATARAAYGAPAAPTRTPRATEYEAIARITARLKAATGRDARDAAGFAELAAALHDNRRLWATLATDVADPGNPLPQALRAQLFWLAEFSDQHSGKVLAGTADPGVLVEINTAVMRGLRGDAGSGTGAGTGAGGGTP